MLHHHHAPPQPSPPSSPFMAPVQTQYLAPPTETTSLLLSPSGRRIITDPPLDRDPASPLQPPITGLPRGTVPRQSTFLDTLLSPFTTCCGLRRRPIPHQSPAPPPPTQPTQSIFCPLFSFLSPLHPRPYDDAPISPYTDYLPSVPGSGPISPFYTPFYQSPFTPGQGEYGSSQQNDYFSYPSHRHRRVRDVEAELRPGYQSHFLPGSYTRTGTTTAASSSQTNLHDPVTTGGFVPGSVGRDSMLSRSLGRTGGGMVAYGAQYDAVAQRMVYRRIMEQRERGYEGDEDTSATVSESEYGGYGGVGYHPQPIPQSQYQQQQEFELLDDDDDEEVLVRSPRSQMRREESTTSTSTWWGVGSPRRHRSGFGSRSLARPVRNDDPSDDNDDEENWEEEETGRPVLERRGWSDPDPPTLRSVETVLPAPIPVGSVSSAVTVARAASYASYGSQESTPRATVLAIGSVLAEEMARERERRGEPEPEVREREVSTETGTSTEGEVEVVIRGRRM